MIPVVLESPYAGDIDRNVAYARRCMSDCLRRGEAPFASHLLYTQLGILDDTDPEERAQGISAGFAWGQHARKVVLYTDYGVSGGMQSAIEVYSALGVPVYRRCIGKNSDPLTLEQIKEIDNNGSSNNKASQC